MQIQGARMFSDNIRQNHQYILQCDDKTPSQSHQIIGDQSPYAQPNENSLTQDDNVQIINENNRNSVSCFQWNAMINEPKGVKPITFCMSEEKLFRHRYRSISLDSDSFKLFIILKILIVLKHVSLLTTTNSIWMNLTISPHDHWKNNY